jgi:hypothetical protein
MQDNGDVLKIIHEYAPLRLTIAPSDELRAKLPPETYFYGVVDSESYRSIIANAKVCNCHSCL